MKNIGGRPIKFTNSVLEDVIYGIAQGFTLKASCKFAGVSYSTLAWWLAKGTIEHKKQIFRCVGTY